MIQILQKNGFAIVRRKGSHVSLEKGIYKTVVPLHRELAKGTLFAILKQCGMNKAALDREMHS
jgi:predicted RNA binding protein YcfA (HicA-like mRNA interferase family)